MSKRKKVKRPHSVRRKKIAFRRRRRNPPAKRRTSRTAAGKGRRTRFALQRVHRSGPTRIKVIGVGGGGGNAVSRMVGSLPRGVELIAVNTDVQDLEHCRVRRKVCIGKKTTRGLGAGMNPELGRQSAEESRSDIERALASADIVFLTAGFGGGTGSGATPVIAEIAKEMGIVTIAVVTKPFTFEGAQRARIAQDALESLRDRVDAFITVPNDRIFSLISKDTSLHKAFLAIDEVLRHAVGGISEIILAPGIINVDFADVRAIVTNSGPALIGIGIASGKERAATAANAAVNSPLLESSLEGARGVLFSICGRRDLKMNEVHDIARMVADNVDSEAKIIFGTYHDSRLPKGYIKVTLIATGFGGAFGRNYTLFGGFEATGGGESPIDRASRAVFQKKSVDISAREGTGRDRIEASNDGVVGEQEFEGSLWDTPAFLRKRKKPPR